MEFTTRWEQFSFWDGNTNMDCKHIFGWTLFWNFELDCENLPKFCVFVKSERREPKCGQISAKRHMDNPKPDHATFSRPENLAFNVLKAHGQCTFILVNVHAYWSTKALQGHNGQNRRRGTKILHCPFPAKVQCPTPFKENSLAANMALGQFRLAFLTVSQMAEVNFGLAPWKLKQDDSYQSLVLRQSVPDTWNALDPFCAFLRHHKCKPGVDPGFHPNHNLLRHLYKSWAQPMKFQSSTL